MSGHSKWSQIKRTKGAKDAKRGVLFSKLSKKISLAAKDGKSGDPALNFKLRTEIDSAKAQGLPNDNIDRAIKKGLGQDGASALEEVVYEGYGPGGSAFIIEAITDNKNRTVSNIKHLFTKNGGNLGASGSASYLFKTIGEIFISNPSPEIELSAIDAGATDTETSHEGMIVYTKPENLGTISEAVKNVGGIIEKSDVVKKSTQEITPSENELQKISELIESLEEDEDVVAVYTNTNL